MSIAELIEYLGRHSRELLIFFVAIPLFSLIYGQVVSRGKERLSPHKYVFAALIYLTCVPGIFAAVITAYSLFFLRENLLTVNYTVYFLPIISMIITIAVIRKYADLDKIPGFDRLKGLMLLLALTFIIALLLIRLRVWILFGGSMASLLIIIALIFLLLRWSARMLLQRH